MNPVKAFWNSEINEFVYLDKNEKEEYLIKFKSSSFNESLFIIWIDKEWNKIIKNRQEKIEWTKNINWIITIFLNKEVSVYSVINSNIQLVHSFSIKSINSVIWNDYIRLIQFLNSFLYFDENYVKKKFADFLNITLEDLDNEDVFEIKEEDKSFIIPKNEQESINIDSIQKEVINIQKNNEFSFIKKFKEIEKINLWLLFSWLSGSIVWIFYPPFLSVLFISLGLGGFVQYYKNKIEKNKNISNLSINTYVSLKNYLVNNSNIKENVAIWLLDLYVEKILSKKVLNLSDVISYSYTFERFINEWLDNIWNSEKTKMITEFYELINNLRMQFET